MSLLPSDIPLWVKVIATVAALAMLWAAYGAWHHSIYKSGYDAAMVDNAKAVEKQKAADAKHQIQVAKTIEPIQSGAQPKIDASIAMTPVIIRTVKEYVHDAPTFAACVRPAPLDQLRSTQLQALRAAAAASPFPAAGSTVGLPRPAAGG